MPAVVEIGWKEVALAGDEGEAVVAFIFLVCQSVVPEYSIGRPNSREIVSQRWNEEAGWRSRYQKSDQMEGSQLLSLTCPVEEQSYSLTVLFEALRHMGMSPVQELAGDEGREKVSCRR
jgi:hypothetical protein